MTKTSLAKIITYKRGSVSQIFAIVSLALIMTIGLGIDLSIIARQKAKLQSIADSAILSTLADYDNTITPQQLELKMQSHLALYKDTNISLQGEPYITSEQACLEIQSEVPTMFIHMVQNSNVVKVISCANIRNETNVEISLVLDVSSSMIEKNRFTPMQAAAKKFIKEFEAAPSINLARISIVPFSSRVNIGMLNANTIWLKPYDSNPAIPERWTNPDSTYASNPTFSKAFWLDGVTVNEYTSKNYYWMGCIEPRSDVEIMENGSLGPYGLSDEKPAVAPFIAMDSNTESAKSFCPPPITPLSDDYETLNKTIDALTSEGSTRLDVGIIAGWYTLSPKWHDTWPTNSHPEDYSNTVKKVIVFMTDGQMNTQYKQSVGKFDWRCILTLSSACNAAANNDFINICQSMKNDGIEIYTIAYSKEADTNYIKKCATDVNHFYIAAVESSDNNYIEKIYANIASKIHKESLHLTK